MRRISTLALAALLAACTTSVAQQPRNADAQSRLARALAGKHAGAPANCLPPGSGWNTEAFGDTILFTRHNETYRTDPPGGCHPFGQSGYALITQTSLSSLCTGDIANVVDTSTHITAGSCGLGPFVPYR